MTHLVAGIDIGNTTTEIVVSRIGPSSASILWSGRVPTAGAKGSHRSLVAAASLVTRAAAECGRRPDLLAVAPLVSVHTATVMVPPAPLRAVVRERRRSSAGTPAGSGASLGRHRSLASLLANADDPDATQPIVVSLPDPHDFDEAAHHVRRLLAVGWPIVALLSSDDDAVLLHHRIDADLPVVDEVDLVGLREGQLVAVEVMAAHSVARRWGDPVAVAHALGIGSDLLSALAAQLRELADAPASALTLAPEVTAVPELVAVDHGTPWVEVETLGGRHRLSVHDAARLSARDPDLTVRRLWLGSELREVADATVVSMRAIDDGAWLRRGIVEATATVVANLTAEPATNPQDRLARLTSIPTVCLASEAQAATLGVGSTPGVPEGAAVCDIGGGTVDCVHAGRTVIRAGAGELVTRVTAAALGIPRGLAEHVKRRPAVRVEGVHLAHGEDGRRTFLPEPAQPAAAGSLCVASASELLPFSTTLAPEEWRSLRLAIKRSTVGASVSRALRALDTTPQVLVLAGGGAMDDELVRTVSEELLGQGTVVARADVAGRFGPRYAVATGLTELAARHIHGGVSS
ncbi:diol dehydratase reactivase ATPase-like domain-containing protein [Nocardioides zhouii]|uniref:Diol dehydratase reactivase n=1 Tax=Nocardioides zhouii TaxID=1168729 RepID=A0A4Q2SQ58_9ACTN|nr:diol dehydratase reactivase ATPase-like domain-containing protein [Nocardioides zhouii]RYC07271.1 diol dehydratase reactivase [Nocardioides zhouii]